MSSLGIRFATPYKGSNGIKVNGAVIEIDPKSTIQFYNGLNYDVSDKKSKINFNSIDIANSNNGNIQNLTSLQPEYIILKDFLNTIQNELTGAGFIVYNSVEQATNNTSSSGSQITKYSNDGAVIIGVNNFDKDGVNLQNLDVGVYCNFNPNGLNISPYQISHDDGIQLINDNLVNIIGGLVGAVVPDLTQYIQINVGGNNYKLIIAQ